MIVQILKEIVDDKEMFEVKVYIGEEYLSYLVESIEMESLKHHIKTELKPKDINFDVEFIDAKIVIISGNKAIITW